MIKLSNIFMYNLATIIFMSVFSTIIQFAHYLLIIMQLNYGNGKEFKLIEISIDQTTNSTDPLIIKQKEFFNFYHSNVVPTFVSSFIVPISITGVSFVIYILILIIMACIGKYKSLSFVDEQINKTYSPLYVFIILLLFTFFYWVLVSPIYCGLFWNGVNTLNVYYNLFQKNYIESTKIVYKLIYHMVLLIILNAFGSCLLIFAILFMINCKFKILYAKIRDLKKRLQEQETANSTNNNDFIQFRNEDVEIKSVSTIV